MSQVDTEQVAASSVCDDMKKCEEVTSSTSPDGSGDAPTQSSDAGDKSQAEAQVTESTDTTPDTAGSESSPQKRGADSVASSQETEVKKARVEQEEAGSEVGSQPGGQAGDQPATTPAQSSQ